MLNDTSRRNVNKQTERYHERECEVNDLLNIIRNEREGVEKPGGYLGF